jgi:short subunit dehydrogenase-like uncharacterized protein
MSGRVVLLGATGYTGELTARAMARRGMRPVLAGRRRDALEALADEVGGVEVAVADVARPETVRALVGRGDVLVTTVGPFVHWGDAALEAAIDAGAHYVDSTGESPFVRRVFEQADRRARAAGSLLLTQMAYDSVPGNLAAALALREAGPAATGVRIGYFLTGGRRQGLRGGLSRMSGGSRATFAELTLEPQFAWRDGRLVTERGSARVGSFDIDGKRRKGVSFGTSEAFSVPRLHRRVRDVEVYFGWFEEASRMMQIGSLALSGVARIPGARAGLTGLARRFVGSSPGGPEEHDTGSLFVAEATAASGDPLAGVRLEGINGYEFSGNVLAWAAERVAAGEGAGTGALGPVEAFGLEPLEAGVAECGIARPILDEASGKPQSPAGAAFQRFSPERS